MNKTISFKKDLLFRTRVHNIESIDLIDNVQQGDDHSLTGDFEIKGQYKMTIASVNKEPFSFKLPFDIAVDPKYDLTNVNLEVADFRYELINNEILRVNIEVDLHGLMEKHEREEPPELEQEIETNIENTSNIEQPVINETTDFNTHEEEVNVYKPSINLTSEHEETTTNIDDVKSIFNNISNEEKYVTYNVYQFTSGDDINDIVEQYHTDIDTVRNYNNLANLKPGDKIIIPKPYE